MKDKSLSLAGVLFDFDGVVVDSFQSHFTAWNNAHFELFSSKIETFPHAQLAGKSPYIIAEYFANEAGDIHKSQELFQLKGSYLHKSATSPKLLPGVLEIQGFLAEKNIAHGIASNATHQFVQNSVTQLDLGFTTLFGLEDYTHPKPHPEAYLTLAKALHISSKDFGNTWVFEDSITGTKAAVAAGMVPIGVLTMNTEAEMLKAGSHLCFPTLLEAYQYLSTKDIQKR